MIAHIKTLFNLFLTLGSDETTNENELKKIKLLNLACLIWHLLTIVNITEKLILKKNESSFLIQVAVLVTILVVDVQVFQCYKKFFVARLLFLYSLIFMLFLLSNYIFKGEHLEFYLVVPAIVSLILLENKKIIFVVVVTSICLSFFPNYYYHHYEYSKFNTIGVLVLFIPIVLLINYFKNLNMISEQKLKAKQKELEDLNQFRSQFFTNISHEIRTPLTIINGQVSDLNKFTKKSTKLNIIQTSIKKQVNNITNMVDNVLDLAKMQTSNFSLHLKPTNITEIVHKQFLNFEPLFKQKNISFTINKKVESYISEIDILFIERAINNLIVNALKYTNEGSVSIKLKEHNNLLFIEIRDTGIGIKDTDLEKVFSRFYQVNNDINEAGGSGVGLAFSKEIIELHGGQLSLESEVNKGSVFTIKLPLIKKEAIAAVQEFIAVEEETNIESNETIKYSPPGLIFLIVDDNYDMRKYLVSLLKKHTCVEASNGLEALEVISNQNVDFIITDYMMPKLNGYEFIRRLKEKNNTIPVIMLTAKTDIRSKIGVLELGVDDYLIKPFNRRELLIRINNCINNSSSKTSFIKENKIEKKDYDSEFIEKLKDYINENISKNINQELISENLNVSKSSLYRKIKSNTGLSPNNLIKEIRLLKAHEIAKNNPNILLKQLSSEVGFQSDSYFSKIYFDRFGEKPN